MSMFVLPGNGMLWVRLCNTVGYLVWGWAVSIVIAYLVKCWPKINILELLGKLA